MNPAGNNSPNDTNSDSSVNPVVPSSSEPQIGFPTQTEDLQPGFSAPTFSDTGIDQPVAPSPAQTPDSAAQTELPPTSSPTGVSSAGLEPETITTAPQKTDGNGNKKKILAGIVILVMFLGIGAGAYALQRNRPENASAWDCSLYVSSLQTNGTLMVTNGSSRTEQATVARISINNIEVGTVNIPSLVSGQGVTLQSNINLPIDESYSWKVQIAECTYTGNSQVVQARASCSDVKAYDKNWQVLSQTELSRLKEGDIVRFAVSGDSSAGSFDMARFSINGASAETSTDKKPNSEEFYLEYEIPKNEDAFNVSAEIHHSEYGWF